MRYGFDWDGTLTNYAFKDFANRKDAEKEYLSEIAFFKPTPTFYFFAKLWSEAMIKCENDNVHIITFRRPIPS